MLRTRLPPRRPSPSRAQRQAVARHRRLPRARPPAGRRRELGVTRQSVGDRLGRRPPARRGRGRRRRATYLEPGRRHRLPARRAGRAARLCSARRRRGAVATGVEELVDGVRKGVAHTSNCSRQPCGLPGRLTISVRPRMPLTPRESMACGVLASEAARIASAMPGASRSRTASVASGVTSREVRPVPPVVRIRFTAVASAQRRARRR